MGEVFTLDPARLNPASMPRALTVNITASDGVRAIGHPGALGPFIQAGLFWVDLCGGTEIERAGFLRALRMGGEADLRALQSFGRRGELTVAGHRLAATTWLWGGASRGMTELHLLCIGKRIVTVCNGEPAALDDIREHLAQRIGQLGQSPLTACAILLQRLVGTLHFAISETDEKLLEIQAQLRSAPRKVDLDVLDSQLQRLQAAWSELDRYSSLVTSAIVGVEALIGIDADAVRELNDYAEQVERLEHRLHDRTRWGVDLVQDYATAIAQRQGEQIGRLTVVSMIFLPITFLTGFFGMNFRWLAEVTNGPGPFLVLGIATPIVCAAAIVFWLRRRRLL